MLLFQTVFKINNTITKDEFIKLIIDWNRNSPHKDNVIKEINWLGEKNIRYGNDQVWLGIEEYQEKNIIAVRYEKRDNDGIIWDSDYVMNFSEGKLAIRLERSYTDNALNMRGDYRTPHFIKTLIDNGYSLGSEIIPISYRPLKVDTLSNNILNCIAAGECPSQIPVIVVFKTDDGNYPLDCWNLAYRLKGVAYVLIQNNDDALKLLKDSGMATNCDSGDVIVYYPNSVIEPTRFLYENLIEQNDYWIQKLCRQITYFNSSKKVEDLYTWQGVNNAIIKDKFLIQSDKRKAAEEACQLAENLAYECMDKVEATKKELIERAKDEEKLLSAEYEAEMQNLLKRVEKLTRDNERLRIENDGLKYKIDEFDSKPLLHMGVEQEFYPGEITDLILLMLKEHVQNIEEDSRRYHIVNDILKTNDYKAQSEHNAERIKVAMKSYTYMDSKTESILHNLGFSISDDGKHYKVKYYDDNRYQFTFAKTASDFRAGKNDASRVVRKVF